MSDGERRTRCWSIPHYRKLLVHSKSQCNSKSPTVIKRVYYLIEIFTQNAILTIYNYPGSVQWLISQSDCHFSVKSAVQLMTAINDNKKYLVTRKSI